MRKLLSLLRHWPLSPAWTQDRGNKPEQPAAGRLRIRIYW